MTFEKKTSSSVLGADQETPLERADHAARSRGPIKRADQAGRSRGPITRAVQAPPEIDGAAHRRTEWRVAARTETVEYPRSAGGRRHACAASLLEAFHAASSTPSASQLSDASRRCAHHVSVTPLRPASPVRYGEPRAICIVEVVMVRSSLDFTSSSVGSESRFLRAQFRRTQGQRRQIMAASFARHRL